VLTSTAWHMRCFNNHVPFDLYDHGLGVESRPRS
jgi:hypothetical protein